MPPLTARLHETHRAHETVHICVTFGDSMKLRFLLSFLQHDSMIAATMMALNVWDGNQPPYGTALIFELHQKTGGSWFVKVLHKNDTTTNLWGMPFELQIPGQCVLVSAVNLPPESLL